MRRIAIAACAAALLAPVAARAQGAYRFELTPQVSYRWGGTISGDNNSLFNTDLKVDKPQTTVQVDRDLAATRYSPLAQITTQNVASLTPAWTYFSASPSMYL